VRPDGGVILLLAFSLVCVVEMIARIYKGLSRSQRPANIEPLGLVERTIIATFPIRDGQVTRLIDWPAPEVLSIPVVDTEEVQAAFRDKDDTFINPEPRRLPSFGLVTFHLQQVKRGIATYGRERRLWRRNSTSNRIVWPEWRW
jgi:hypothetical protein